MRLVTRLHIAVGGGVKKQADERRATRHFLSVSKMSTVTVAMNVLPTDYVF